jgi:uncharacterized protein YkwD
MRYAGCLLLLALGSSGVIGPPLRSQPPPPAMKGLTTDEKKFLELTNAERAKHKLPPLKFNATLSKVARAYSENMAKQGKMVHDLDGKKPGQRVKEAGYRYAEMGENLARGDEAMGLILERLMESPSHRKHILYKEFTEIGVGLARTDKGVTYYTQVFATPKKSP